MPRRASIGSFVAVAAILASTLGAQALDDSKYPDWRGQWRRINLVSGPASFDPTKTVGPGQQAPLIPEYQAIHKAALADMDAGGFGIDRTNSCFSPGMPRIMNLYTVMEILIVQDATTTIPACRCTRTTRPSSGSASTRMRPTATSCTMRSPSSTTR